MSNDPTTVEPRRDGGTSTGYVDVRAMFNRSDPRSDPAMMAIAASHTIFSLLMTRTHQRALARAIATPRTTPR